DGGRGFDVEDGIEAEGIGKIQISARDAITIARKIQIAGENVDVTEQDGMLSSPAHAEINVCLELRPGPFHAGVGCEEPFDVELQIAQIRRSGRGSGDSFFGGDEHPRDLEALGESDALNDHTTGKDGITGC